MDKKELKYNDTLLIRSLWYEFLNDFDAQRDFGKRFETKKANLILDS